MASPGIGVSRIRSGVSSNKGIIVASPSRGMSSVPSGVCSNKIIGIIMRE